MDNQFERDMRFNTHIKSLAYHYIKLLNIKVAKTTIFEDLEVHPHFPTLFSLSDTFTRYNIPNYSYRCEASKLVGLTAPYFAYFSVENAINDFVLVTDVDEFTITYIYDRKPECLRKNDFYKRYKNIVWYAEPSENSGDMNYDTEVKKQNKLEYQKVILFGGVIFILLFLISRNITYHNSIAYSFLVLIKFIGLVVTCGLLVYEIDGKNKVINDICNTSGKKRKSCTAVLDSEASKLVGVSWSEIGFFYFAGTFIFLLIPQVPFSEKLCWIAIANFFTLPYVPFSIIYQKYVVREWCVFCLSVQAVFILELICLLFVFYWKIPFNIISISTFLTIIVCFLIPCIIWYSLKTILTRYINYDYYVYAYTRLRHDRYIFNYLLKQQKEIPTGWEDLGIVIGNPDAENEIVKICNTFCTPCSETHKHIDYIVKHKKNTCVRIIYVIPNFDHDAAYAIKHLLAIAEMEQNLTMIDALHDWYSPTKKDYKQFSKKHPIEYEKLEEQSKKLDDMSSWALNAEIQVTPTFFVNRHQLPKNYHISDLKYIL